MFLRVRSRLETVILSMLMLTSFLIAPAMERQEENIQLPTAEGIKAIKEKYAFNRRIFYCSFALLAACLYGDAKINGERYREQRHERQQEESKCDSIPQVCREEKAWKFGLVAGSHDYYYTSCYRTSEYYRCMGQVRQKYASSFFVMAPFLIPFLAGVYCYNRSQCLNAEYEKYAFVPLANAIKNGNHRDLIAIIKADSIRMKNPITGYTPLHIAVAYDQEGIVKMLLDKGAHQKDEILKDTDANGKTPLHIAVQWNDERIAKILLDKGAPQDDKMIIDGINTDNPQLLKLLLAPRKNPNIPLRMNTEWALNYAILCGKKESVRTFLEAGASRNLRNTNADGKPGKNAYELAQENNMTALVYNYQQE